MPGSLFGPCSWHRLLLAALAFASLTTAFPLFRSAAASGTTLDLQLDADSSHNTPSLVQRAPLPGTSDNSAPVPIGTNADENFVTQTNNTLQFSSLMSLKVVSNSTNVSMFAEVAALTAAVGRTTTFPNGIEGICAGKLISTRASTSIYIGYPDIALINCDDDANQSGTSATEQLINYAVQSSDCVLLYSLHSNSCNFTSGYKIYASQMGLVLTTLSTVMARSIAQAMNETDDLTAVITPSASTKSGSSSSNSSGSGYSTVPMAILYSVTGLVAAIFLFIIISGAIRVHKHPERYGLPPPGGYPEEPLSPSGGFPPGSMYSQRAKGLARAVLDSIPLVTARVRHKQDQQQDENNTGVAVCHGSSASPDPACVKTEGMTATREIEHKEDADKDCNSASLRQEQQHNSSSSTSDEAYELSTFYSVTSKASSTNSEHVDSDSPEPASNSTPPASSNSDSPPATTNTAAPTIPQYTYTTLTPSPAPPALPEYPTTSALEQLDIDDNDETLCPICFETFADGEILRVLPCHHRFHAPCVDPWLLNSSSHCPMCRVDLSIERSTAIPDQPRDALNDSDNDTTTGSSAGAAGPSRSGAQPPASSSSSSGQRIVVPEGYEVETSFFNRFLDVWNAHLLPRDARRAALARFHEEAELRRQLREHSAGETDTSANGAPVPPTTPAIRSLSLSGAGARIRNLPSLLPFTNHNNTSSNPSDPSIPDSENVTTSHGSSSSSPPDCDEQNRNRWLRFVASRRYIHQLRTLRGAIHHDSSHSNVQEEEVPTQDQPATSEPGPGYYYYNSGSAPDDETLTETSANSSSNGGGLGRRRRHRSLAGLTIGTSAASSDAPMAQASAARSNSVGRIELHLLRSHSQQQSAQNQQQLLRRATSAADYIPPPSPGTAPTSGLPIPPLPRARYDYNRSPDL